MLISEITDGKGQTRVVARIDAGARLVNGADSVYALALEAARGRESLRTVLDRRGLGDSVDLAAAYEEGRLNTPISHPDPAHLHITGTGLTHLGSAATRDSMHKKLTADGAENLTDSMKMFRMGLESGKPARGEVGVQPEWFYKGNGVFAVAPGKPLVSPDFAKDAGEEPEIAGIYVIGDDGTPFRVGFALSNEFSDHVTERVNYLYLAHSKLRNAAFGPEILVGPLPDDIRGTSRIHRAGKMSSGKSRSCRARRTCRTASPISSTTTSNTGCSGSRATCMSTCSGPRRCRLPTASGPKPGDVFEIEAEAFGLPLRNPLAIAEPAPFEVRAL